MEINFFCSSAELSEVGEGGAWPGGTKGYLLNSLKLKLGARCSPEANGCPANSHIVPVFLALPGGSESKVSNPEAV